MFQFKVANCWKGRKIRLKTHLIERKSCNLLTLFGKYSKCKQVCVCGGEGGWKVQGRVVVPPCMEKKRFFQKVKSRGS